MASDGMVVEEEIDHQDHQNDGDKERLDHIGNRGVEEILRAGDVGQHHAFGERRGDVGRHFVDLFDDLVGVRAGGLGHHAVGAGVSARLTEHRIVLGTEFDAGHVFQPQHAAVGQRAYDHVLVVGLLLVTAAVFQHILKRIGRFGPQRPRRGLHILLGQHRGDIRGHQSVLRHLRRIEPDAQRIAGAPDIHLAHARDTRHPRLDVDLHVVGQEVGIVTVVGRIERYGLQRIVLTLAHRHARLRDFGRKQSLRRSHAVLYVDHRHVGVGALPEVDVDGGRTGVGGRRGHIDHVLHAVELLLEGRNDALHHRLGVGSGIGGADAHGGRGDVGKLFDGQTAQADQPDDDDGHGDDARKDRTVYECANVHDCIFLSYDKNSHKRHLPAIDPAIRG